MDQTHQPEDMFRRKFAAFRELTERLGEEEAREKMLEGYEVICHVHCTCRPEPPHNPG
jgi:hypothetical protein